MANVETKLVMLPLDQYVELMETKTRYKILAEHIENVLRNEEPPRVGFNDGLFKAVIGFKETVEQKGEGS